MQRLIPRILGAMLILLGVVSAVRPGIARTSAPDTTGSYLEQLQRTDTRKYSHELLESDPAVRDSALALLDSLGFEGYLERARIRMPPWDLSVVPAGRLLAYDRAEGLVLGAGVDLASNRSENLKLSVQGAWATASGAFRHDSRLWIPAGPFVLVGGYADRVVPFGSNRITLNGLRAFVGGSDDQDYLRRKGGWGGVRLEPIRQVTVRAVYEAAEERSVRTRSVWSLFGDLDDPIPAADEGTLRSVRLDVEAGAIDTSREHLELGYRLAGGDLGGDYAFHRISAEAAARRYLPAGTEAVLSLGWRETGGDVPFQELADVGGLSTVRGFARRTRVGGESVNGRLEAYLPLDPLALTHIPVLERGRVQVVLWGDAARVWQGGSDAWLTSLGFGLQRYLGPLGSAANLRLDVAFPTGPDRPDDAAVFLRFTPALF